MTAAPLAGCTEHSWETSVCLLATKPGALWQRWGCSHYRLWQPHIMTNIPLPAVQRQLDCSCTKGESFSDCICKIQSILPISDSNLGCKNGNDFSVYLNAFVITYSVTLLELISHHWRLCCEVKQCPLLAKMTAVHQTGFSVRLNDWLRLWHFNSDCKQGLFVVMEIRRPSITAFNVL